MKAVLFFLLISLSSTVVLSQKDGTIVIKKKQTAIIGLFEQRLERSKTPTLYLFFKNQEYVYQIKSDLKRKEVLRLVEEDLGQLRPVVANYKFNDSIVKIIPLSQGIGQGMEPGSVNYYGKLNKGKLMMRQPGQITVVELYKIDIPEN